MGLEDDVDVKQLLATMAQLLKQQTERKTETVDRSNEVSYASLNAIEARIHEFTYSPEDGATFERWWARHEDIFLVDLKDWEEVKKIRLLTRHVSMSVERTLTESIAPTKMTDMTLQGVISKMSTLFGDNTSLFDRRRRMLDLKMSKESIEDVRILAARVNQTVENAQVKDATINEWKVLTFLHALDLPRYSDVHMKMMHTAKQKGKDCTLDDLISVFNDISQLKNDSRMITESSREVNYVDHRYNKNKDHQRNNRQRRDGSTDSESTVLDGHTACDCCGNEGHSSLNCRFRSVKCNNCGTKGHLARVCKKFKKVNTVSVANGSASIYRIQVKINGLPMSMMIDTGADITIVSEGTWKHLGSPAYERDKGTVKCANGDDLKLRGRFVARMEYGGICATSDVYVVRGRMDILGKNFIKLLQLVKVRVPEAKNNELVKANVPEANVRLVKASTPEANLKNLVKIQGSEANEINIVKVREPEAKEINCVKVDSEAESSRDHIEPEATVKVYEPETNYRSTEIDMKMNFPSDDEKDTDDEMISSHASTRIRNDSVMDQKCKGVIPDMEYLVKEIERNLMERNRVSEIHIANFSSTSSTTRGCITDHFIEGKPHKKTYDGKPHKKMIESSRAQGDEAVIPSPVLRPHLTSFPVTVF